MRPGRGAPRLLAVYGLLLADPALAQLSAQVGVASDYVYRGVSLNDGNPAVMAAVNYDSTWGGFVGGQVAQTRLYGEHHAEPLWTIDAGYAHALTSRLSWEVGATYSIFSNFTFWNYAETFVGISSENWNLRLYHAPNYFGRQRRSDYIELNGAYPLNDRWRLIGHLGVQQTKIIHDGDRDRTYDASFGVGTKLDRVNLQLLWVVINRANYVYPSTSPDDRRRWVLSANYAF